MGNNRNAFFCPAALPQAAWDTNVNPTIKTVIGEDGKIDYYGIATGATDGQGTRFSLGYNDWGISINVTPQLGLGGDIDGGFARGAVKESMIRSPSAMIAVGDIRSDAPAGQIQFNANMDPTAATGQGSGVWHVQVPCNRHNFHTDLLCCDAHVESPRRRDVVDPNNYYWRSRWNNDNNPHPEVPSWTIPSEVLEK